MRPMVHVQFLVNIMILTASSAFAQSQASGGAASGSGERAVISGHVSINGSPAIGQTMILSFSERLAGPYQGGPNGELAGRATTDCDGNYQFNDVVSGDYRVFPGSPTMASINENKVAFGGLQRVSVRGAEVIGPIDFELTQGGVITGRVTLPNGRPAIEAAVWISRDGTGVDVAGKGPAVMRMAEKTDDQGNYRIYGLAPDHYLVRAYMAGSQKSAFYYTDADDPRKAGVVTVSSGQEVSGVDIAIGAIPRNYQALGIVVDDNGNPVPNVPYAPYDVVGNALVSGVSGQNSLNLTDAQGQFRIQGLSPGKYAVGVVNSGGSVLCSDLVHFEVDSSDVIGLRVQAHIGASVSGVVAIEGTDDPRILSQLADQELVVGPGAVTNNALGQDVPIANDGSFFASGLNSGVLRINVDSPDDTESFAVTRIELNGAPLTDGFSLTPGQQVTGLRVVLVPSSGTIRGQVTLEGGSLSTGLRVLVFAGRSQGSQGIAAASDMADVQGRFELHGLQDGQYSIYAMCLGGATRLVQQEPVVVTVSSGQAPETNVVLGAVKKQ
jgi:hypothetical protein